MNRNETTEQEFRDDGIKGPDGERVVPKEVGTFAFREVLKDFMVLGVQRILMQVYCDAWCWVLTLSPINKKP